MGLIANAWACGPLDRKMEIQITGHRVLVELAISEQEKACGLAFRDGLDTDHGMLFVYPNERDLAFWMKDTRIPLSLAFIDSKGAILDIFQMKAMDTEHFYRPSAPARFALEMSENWFLEHRVKPGDRVQIPLAGSAD